MSTEYSKPIQSLIDQFSQLPGIGPKTAQRLVFFLISHRKKNIDGFISALEGIKMQIIICGQCQNYSQTNPCAICSDKRRDHETICVVAKPQDIAVIEKTEEFKGIYHLLGGTLNPIEGITSDKIRTKELIERIKKQKIKEVILALNPDIEGETTSLFLVNQLKPLNVKISKLARGLPMGADVEYADEVTLANAFKGRREII